MNKQINNTKWSSVHKAQLTDWSMSKTLTCRCKFVLTCNHAPGLKYTCDKYVKNNRSVTLEFFLMFCLLVYQGLIIIKIIQNIRGTLKNCCVIPRQNLGGIWLSYMGWPLTKKKKICGAPHHPQWTWEDASRDSPTWISIKSLLGQGPESLSWIAEGPWH